jgi:hypothetical protein
MKIFIGYIGKKTLIHIMKSAHAGWNSGNALELHALEVIDSNFC